jgi:murein DD-endopeptidase MepM/ murein hydrolase activator NlpD
MRRLVAPLLVGLALVVTQGAIVLAAGAPSLADSRPSGPVGGAGGAGPALGPGATVDLATAGRLDGSDGIAHLASVTAARSHTAQAQSQTQTATSTDVSTTEGKPERKGPAYSYPVTWGTPISGDFGEVSSSWPRGHAGLDFNGETGDPVYAATDGRVQYAEFNYGGYGNLVMIMRADGTQTRYAHLDKIKVSKGQRVSAGDLIGTMGNTGHSSGSHLHFEVRVGKALTPTNPAGLWTGSRPGIPAKPPAWACRNFGC